MNCRFCNTEVTTLFIDLGATPLANSFLSQDDLLKGEVYYPLKIFVCTNCWLVQTMDFVKANEIFVNDYIYFSSYSSTWLKHAEKYVDTITDKLNLSSKSMVVEIASNDGYLLQYFLRKSIPALGIEPTAQTACEAEKKGITTLVEYFTLDMAKKLVTKGTKADLIIGNNVFAHVPDINNFVEGMKHLLKANGTITLEFPHLLKLIQFNQFDTIYHEHYSYYSLTAACEIFNFHKLAIYDVEELETHGGSLRLYIKHIDDPKAISSNIQRILDIEKNSGLNDKSSLSNFAIKAEAIKINLLTFLLEQKKQNRKVVSYGAAAKGNTLLNFSGIKNDLIEYVIDASPHKQGKYLPGSRIPVVNEKQLTETKPDYILILPWNIKEEIMNQLSYVRNWDAKFVWAIPKLEVL